MAISRSDAARGRPPAGPVLRGLGNTGSTNAHSYPIARDTEHYFVMHLDVRHTVKLVELVSIGVLDSARVHPRETFRRAIVEGSASIIVAHNHPSGIVTPSDDDIRATKMLHEAGEILGIPLTDHIIFTSDQYHSFRANGTGAIRD